MVKVEFEYYEPMFVATMEEALSVVEYYTTECDEVCWVAE